MSLKYDEDALSGCQPEADRVFTRGIPVKHCGSKGKKRVAGGKKKSGDPCWPGSEAMGLKQKGGRTGLNCAPKGKKKVGKK